MSTIINTTTKGYETQDHRDYPDNWNGDGWIAVPTELESLVIENAPYCDLEIDDGVLVNVILTERPEPEPEPSAYIPTIEQSVIVMMKAMFSSQASTMDDDQIIQCSGLADDWKPGDHKQGEIYNADNQTWECYQAYNNDVYPEVKPSDPSWYTFNRPLHGKSPETARPFVPVQGAHDMYRAGEYMIFTDGLTYRCKSDTNFSPMDYPDAWEVYE